MNSRDQNDVQMGGIMGIAVATIVAGGLAVLIVAGAQGIAQSPSAQAIAKAAGEQAVDPAVLRALLPRSPSTIAFQGEQAVDPAVLRATDLMKVAVGGKAAGIFMYLLALAAFPPACFSSFIAANSFKTTLPKVNPFVSVGIGAAVAALLAISGVAGQVIDMFSLIGASFGPVCGAMAADYLLAGKKWPGPRAGFNLAGWISWAVGFVVGAARFIGLGAVIPCPPVAAFLVGFVLYAILAKAGMESQTLEMPKTEEA